MAIRSDGYADSSLYGSPAAWTCPRCNRPAIPDARFPGSELLVSDHAPSCPTNQSGDQADARRIRRTGGESV